MVARRAVRKARKVVKRAPRRKAAKRSSASQMATITETIELSEMKANTPYSLVFNLSQFERASTLAPSFRWYKAAKVTWTLESLYNTYQDGVGGDTIPYLYKIMDRTQNSSGFYLNDLQASGVKPVKMIGTKTYTFAPNWCSSGLTTYGSNPETGALTSITALGLRAQYSYLATPDIIELQQAAQFLVPVDPRIPLPVAGGMNSVNTNNVCYNGMDMYIDQKGNLNDPYLARLRCTVTWMFKDPKFHSTIAPKAVELKVAAV